MISYYIPEKQSVLYHLVFILAPPSVVYYANFEKLCILNSHKNNFNFTSNIEQFTPYITISIFNNWVVWRAIFSFALEIFLGFL
jgi:hypothetical protein